MAEPRRVRVTAPRTGDTAGDRAGDTAGDRAGRVAEQAAPDAGDVRSLMCAQLRLALVTCGVVGLVVGALPLVFALAPELSAVRLHGVPLPWLILGLGVQPLWIAAAVRHIRRAERTERDFVDRAERT
jgi:hypothetical protein